MSQFVPVRRVIERIQQLGLSWADVVDDLDHAESVTPVIGYDTRLRYCGEKVQAYVEPGVYDGEQALFIVGLRERQRAEEPVPVGAQVVGRSTATCKSGRRGGAGSRWPTTLRELVERIDAHPHAKVVPGGKHLIVTLNGKQVQALPRTASDHRSLRNAAQVLTNLGIDVRRPT